MKKIVVAFAVLFSTALFSYAFIIPDKPTGYVNDYANILSTDVKQSLEENLKSFTASTSNEIAVVTIPDLGGDTVENYASKLFASWKIGTAKNDNGILLLISRDDRKLRIEVGYGLEGALPDILAKDIIDNKITPPFKQGNYDSGVVEGVKAIEEVTRGEYKAKGGMSFVDQMLAGGFVVVGIFILTLIVWVRAFAAMFARSKSWWAGGLFGAMVGWAIAYWNIFGLNILNGSLVTLALTIFGFLFDYIVSNIYKNSSKGGGTVPWWIGGGRSSSGGSSFGGFSGGSSGGGGASGSW